MLTFEQFEYAFVNTLPAQEQKEAYKYAVPETTKIFFKAHLLPSIPKVHSQFILITQSGPLLIIAGEKDHIVPAAMVKKIFQLNNQKSGVITQFVELSKRSNWIIAEKGYTGVANYIQEWFQEQLDFKDFNGLCNA
jgi:fermentation-respiration switch protein FrsA (DUF1100 family)